uniref:hypothetical protein n=1 Tax=uncultured Sphingomonas sp. TaxID=158754 RepID=UPI0025ED599E
MDEIIAAAPASQVVRLPTNYEKLYTRAIVYLAADHGAAARQVIRLLIETILVQPGSARGGKRRPSSCQATCTGISTVAEGACVLGAQKARTVG